MNCVVPRVDSRTFKTFAFRAGLDSRSISLRRSNASTATELSVCPCAPDARSMHASTATSADLAMRITRRGLARQRVKFICMIAASNHWTAGDMDKPQFAGRFSVGGENIRMNELYHRQMLES